MGGPFGKAGAGVFELDSTPYFSGFYSPVAVEGGTLRLNYAVTPEGLAGLPVSVSSGATLDLAGPVSQLSNAVNISNSGILLASSSAAQTVGTVVGGTAAAPAGATVVNPGSSLTASQIVQNSLSIQGNGMVSLAPSGSGSTTNPTGPNNTNFSSTLSSLLIAGTSNAWTGTLDIGNNGLVIAYGSGSDPYATILDMIRSGYANGQWTGTGIVSSLAKAAVNWTSPLNIGLQDFVPGQNGNPSSILFEGQMITTSAVLVRLTYMDDLILAGDMNQANATTDALVFAANYGTGTTWTVGDLNHDGVIDTDDALIFAANYVVGLPSLDGTTGSATVLGSPAAAVPEPSSLVLAGLGLLMLLPCRRRCRSAIVIAARGL